MSILPLAQSQSFHVNQSELVLVALWTPIAIALAVGLRIFGRQSIAGPARAEAGESPVPMLAVILLGLLTWVVGVGLVLPLQKGYSTDEARLTAADAWAKLAAVAVMAITLQLIRPGNLRRLGLNLGRLHSGLILGLIGFVIIMPAVQWAGLGTGWVIEHFHLPIDPRHELFRLWAENGRRFHILVVVSAVVIAPLAEELIFRGLLQTALVGLFGQLIGRRGNGSATFAPLARWAAVIYASLAFAMVHEGWTRPMIIVLSFGLGYLYERTGNLWANTALHAIFNGSQVLTFIYLQS